MEAEGLGQEGVEEGEGVDCAGGREACCGNVVVGGGVDLSEEGRGREREEFGAEAGLQVGALGEVVEEVGERYAGGFVAGDQVVEHFGGGG